MGAKMCPSTPDIVNSGTKPAMMMAAEKKIARSTSPADAKMVQSLPETPLPRLASRSVRRRMLRPPGSAEMAEDVFHHHDRRVDDRDRNRSRRSTADLPNSPRNTRIATAKNRANGIVAATIDGAAQIAEKDPLHEKYQDDPERHIVQNGMRRDVDQVLAVINAFDPHARRQDVGIVDLRHLLLDTADRRQALFAAAHHDDAFDDVVIVVLAGDAEARLMADGDARDVAIRTGTPLST